MIIGSVDKTAETQENKILTNPEFYGIVDGRMEELGLFFMLNFR